MENLALWADIAGSIGVMMVLVSYFLLQKEVISATGACYLSLNLIAPILIILSLLVHWNLSAFLLEAAWASISIYGLYKHVYLPRGKST
ncbi:MAG: CBU_0592 family membrane protein [Rickettsiales bacterium]